MSWALVLIRQPTVTLKYVWLAAITDFRFSLALIKMQITKEVLEQRLLGLRDQHSQLQADLYAVDGAIQLVEQMIALSEAPETVPNGNRLREIR
jgi:hypothetical protein